MTARKNQNEKKETNLLIFFAYYFFFAFLFYLYLFWLSSNMKGKEDPARIMRMYMKYMNNKNNFYSYLSILHSQSPSPLPKSLKQNQSRKWTKKHKKNESSPIHRGEKSEKTKNESDQPKCKFDSLAVVYICLITNRKCRREKKIFPVLLRGSRKKDQRRVSRCVFFNFSSKFFLLRSFLFVGFVKMLRLKRE